MVDHLHSVSFNPVIFLPSVHMICIILFVADCLHILLLQTKNKKLCPITDDYKCEQ